MEFYLLREEPASNCNKNFLSACDAFLRHLLPVAIGQVNNKAVKHTVLEIFAEKPYFPKYKLTDKSSSAKRTYERTWHQGKPRYT